MRMTLACLEDGITACGFRKFAGYAARLSPETLSCYVSTTRQFYSVRNAIRGTFGEASPVDDGQIDEIAHGLAGADLVGFSSMTGYAPLTRRVITRLREIAPQTFIVWGGIHPIIHPEDAITADVDAICIGEGEFAFEELREHLLLGRDHTAVKNFWFKRDGKVVRNGFLPLITSEQMETLPFPQYGAKTERIYEPGKGFIPLTVADYVADSGLAYRTVWSIGCPFHCNFCGNTKFIANDITYKKIRHPSARYAVEEAKQVRETFPHVSQITFYDDSFMAIPYREIEKFAEIWKRELGLPFAV